MKHLYLLAFLLFRFVMHSQVVGCNDPMAANFNPAATLNDGSCIYDRVTLGAEFSVDLPNDISETSGLIYYNNQLLTHNDSNDTDLYAIDSVTGQITSRIKLANVRNIDWEDLAQDDQFIYIGDFGNNAKGNRGNLQILRILKERLLTNPIIDTISFSYSDQPLPLPTRGNANKTDFDCEAFIVTDNFFYLFTKQWNSKATALYRLPMIPGAHSAELLGAMDVGGLITGATIHPESGVITLVGYDGLVRPFLYLLYDYPDDKFFSGNIRRIDLAMQFSQLESVATLDGTTFHLTNERLQRRPLVNVPAQLHRINLAPYIGFYVNSIRLNNNDPLNLSQFVAYQDRINKLVTVRVREPLVGAPFFFLDQSGTIALEGAIDALTTQIDASTLARGIYQLRIGRDQGRTTNIIID